VTEELEPVVGRSHDMRGYRGRQMLETLWRTMVRDVREILEQADPSAGDDYDGVARRLVRLLIRGEIETPASCAAALADTLSDPLAGRVNDAAGAIWSRWELILVADRVFERAPPGA
jgi:hypothetical protein